MKMKRWFLGLMLLLAVASFASKTDFLMIKGIGEFSKGEKKNVALDKLGRLSLSPEVKEIFNQKDLLVYAVHQRSEGLYIGTGNNDTLYFLAEKTEEPVKIFQGKGLAINTITEGKGKLYFSETPSNTIYEYDVKSKETKTLASIEGSTYVWRMVFYQDRLFLATGDNAKILEVSLSGKVSELFENSRENHFLGLALFRDILYFSGEGLGNLYRYDIKQKKVDVLYDSYEDEINDIYVGSDGDVFFVTSSQTPKTPGGDFDYTDSFVIQEGLDKKKPDEEAEKKPTSRRVIKNSLYRWSKGKVNKLFTRDGVAFYCVIEGAGGNLYVGATKGIVYRVDLKNNTLSEFLTLNEEQILRLVTSQDKKHFYVGTGNLGKVYRAGFDFALQGEYISRVFNLGGTSKIGSLKWIEQRPPQTQIRFYIRGGNSESIDESWMDWTGPYTDPKGSLTSLGSIKHLQYKVEFLSNNPQVTPYLDEITQPYLFKNRKPTISFFKADYNLSKKNDPTYILPIKWNVFDSDSDQLKYQLFFKAEADKHWLPLTDLLYVNAYQLDTRYMPDGVYQFKLWASDGMDNVELEAEYVEEISKTLTVDNSQPYLAKLSSSQAGGFIRLRGTLKDKVSSLSKGYYSVDAKEWYYFLPEDQMYDSQEENFEIKIAENSLDKDKEEFIVLIRVYDARENQANIRIKINRKGQILHAEI